MLGRKDVKARKSATREKMTNLGLLDMDFEDFTNPNVDDDEDDSDLEAELAALANDDKKPVRRAPPPPIPAVNLDKMVEESLKDDDDVEVNTDDENDPELLEELNELASDTEQTEEDVPTEKAEPPALQVESTSIVDLLQERLKMYKEAEDKATAAGESTRARRFNRGIKTLNDQLKAARAGRPVNEDDIPPVVSTKVPIPAPAPLTIPEPVPVPESPSPVEQPHPEEPVAEATEPKPMDEAKISMLEKRRDEYRHAAVAAKRKGDRDLALGYAKIVKQFDVVISNVKDGQDVDISEILPPPPQIETSEAAPPVPATVPQEEDSHQNSAAPPEPAPAPTPAPSESASDGIPTPKTVLEALMQRLEVYQKQQSKAEEEQNSGKVRRMGRIVKQYQDAIKLHQRGKPIPIDELPTPPGYPPIPVPGAGGPATAPTSDPGTAASAGPPLPPRPAPAPPKPDLPPSEPVAGPSGAPQPPPRSASRTSTTSSDASSKDSSNVRKSPSTRQEKQLAFLLARQKEYRLAALQAKSTDMAKAKEYLRIAKQFEPLIEATHNGLPVDMKTIPASLKTKDNLDFTLVSVEDCLPGTDDEVYKKLLLDLALQAKTCVTTRDHFKKIGDVPNANQFENLAVQTARDLTVLKNAYQRKDPLPKFHYENRLYTILRCNTDLTDNEVELNIIQGINYNVPNPKDVDTYVRFEFPWPSEDPVKDRSPLVKDTNNPEYNFKYTLQIQRSARACQRMFKRHAVKCEVWSRGGFLRSDTLIGTASIKLQPLETTCEIHDSFDLMEGRKQVGGKLEVKIRVRNPILTKQVEQMTLKWLVIDYA